MAARAIWKGQLTIGELELPVKMYSAAQERTVHFRLLDKQSLSPVRQRIVRKTDGSEVKKEEQRKAFALDPEHAVMLTPEELGELEPAASRDIELLRFVAPALLSDQWYDRPYYLGPDDDAKDYFALAQAMQQSEVLGIARWVMRKKRYVGALTALDGYLMMVTLRRAEQVLALPEAGTAPKADPKELKLAERLVDEISGEFDPTLWQDEYQERVHKLIEAKAKGKKVELAVPKRKRASGGLAAQLRQSLASVKERRVA
jgi:DNA end-binding protein Ku